MSSKRQRVMRPAVPAASTQPTPARLGDMTETDVIEAELASLEQGMLQLRLQQQEAQAQLHGINDAIQQQAGAIAGAKRILQALGQRAAERKRAVPAVPVEESVPTSVE